jgi:hypothetical protein
MKKVFSRSRKVRQDTSISRYAAYDTLVPAYVYYRQLRRKARTFRVDLPKKKWCDLWHDHFDSDGVGNHSAVDRQKHLAALFYAFRLVQRELSEQPVPYQVFLNISRQNSESDALYVHTPNPNSTEFPISFEGGIYLTDVPPLLMGRVDLNQYYILLQSQGKETWYTVIPKFPYNS